jgi:hypothetical protein
MDKVYSYSALAISISSISPGLSATLAYIVKPKVKIEKALDAFKTP